MIFTDKLQELHDIYQPEFDKLFNIAWKNQANIGDLLLLHINGFYQEDILLYNTKNNNKLNPHTIGPGHEGHSEFTHYTFIDKYRNTNISKYSHAEYLKLHEWSKERIKEIDELAADEAISIQVEMLIYLKFWEADMIIKKFYQFVRILSSEHYDWYFKIAESSRDSNSLNKRQDILRKEIRDKIKPYSALIYDLIKSTYKTQIRNSIAHSNYSIHGRYIHLNNYIKDDPHSQLQVISFDEWITIFHNTITFHNHYIRLNNVINDFYASLIDKYGNLVEIMVTEKNGKQYPLYIEYRHYWKDWKFIQKTEPK